MARYGQAFKDKVLARLLAREAMQEELARIPRCPLRPHKRCRRVRSQPSIKRSGNDGPPSLPHFSKWPTWERMCYHCPQ